MINSCDNNVCAVLLSLISGGQPFVCSLCCDTGLFRLFTQKYK